MEALLSATATAAAADCTAECRAALDVELFAHGARALVQARESRPKNTNKAYGPKQREWRMSDLCEPCILFTYL